MAAAVVVDQLLPHIETVAHLFGVAAAALAAQGALAEHRHLAETVARLVLQAQQAHNPAGVAEAAHLLPALAATVRSS